MYALESLAYAGVAVFVSASVAAIFVTPAAIVLLDNRLDSLDLYRLMRCGCCGARPRRRVEPGEDLAAALPQPLQMGVAHGAASAAMRRCPRPAALPASAVPITSVVSARRGCRAGSRIRVCRQQGHRARRGRTCGVWAPSTAGLDDEDLEA